MTRFAVWIGCATLLMAATAPARAQLVIDPSAPAPYPMPPKVEEEEKPKEKEPPTYSGERMQIACQCDPERLTAAGLICSEQSPCEIWVEITAARHAGDAVLAIGDLYTASATFESIVLWTADGGATWTETADRLGGVALDELQFFDKEHGWIVGRQLVGGSQRPLLLATDDSGASWSRWQIDEDEDYRGSVLQLRFDSPEHGFVIVERPPGDGDPFEMRETFNGGRSWGIRQVTAGRPALPGSRRRVPEPTARVQEDPQDDSFSIERRAGDSWETIGRFEGLAGVCGRR